MSLRFAARLDARGFDVALDLAPGETVAVLGPNGAGKSTLVGILAGLLRPDSGRAELDGRTLFDLPAEGDGQPGRPGRPGEPARPARWLAPHRRGTGLLAQDALLFPHLSVLDNVAFGLRSAGASRRDAAASATTWLDAVGALDLAQRRPAELSGGQAQRVAVARALAPEPRLLLLDEPLAALDASVAPHLRRLLRSVLADRTTLLVTHDVLDAYALADRVVVMRDGHVVEAGATGQVLGQPQHEFTAQVAGLNLLTGVRTVGGLRTDDGLELAVSVAKTGSSPPVGAPVACAFRPVDVLVRLADGNPSGAGAVRGLVTDLEPRGDVVRVGAGGVRADVSVAHVAHLGLVPGDVVDLIVPSDAALYPGLPA